MTKAEELIKTATLYSDHIKNGKTVVIELPDWLSEGGKNRVIALLGRIRAKAGISTGHVFYSTEGGGRLYSSYLTTWPIMPKVKLCPFEAIV